MPAQTSPLRDTPVASPADQRYAERRVHKGLRLEKKGQLQDAIKCYFEAFERNPRNLDALKLLGRQLGNLDERVVALQLLERALEVNRDDPDIYIMLGNIALEMRMPDAALKLFRIYVDLKPDDFVGYNNVATALRSLEKFDEGIAVLQDVLPRFLEVGELWNTLGTLVSQRDGIEAAQPFFAEAVRLKPKMVTALANCAHGFEQAGIPEKVIEFGERAIAFDPEFSEAHFVTAAAHLVLGDLPRGWQEYEWRLHWKRPDAMLFMHGLPRWEGEDLTGKSILVCPEQGVGDEIMFAGLLPEVYDTVEKLYVGCDPRLVSLFQRSFPDAVVGPYRDIMYNAKRHRDFPWLKEIDAEIDCYIEIGSLGRFLRPTLDSFPDRQGYLTPDPERVAFWRARFAELGEGPKIGVAWRSGLITHERSKEYTRIDMWGPVFAHKDKAQFINLQYGDCAEERAEARDKFGVDLAVWEDINLKDDLDDVTALTAALDLAITPGAAPGMIAISTGVPLWLTLRTPPYWTFGQVDKTPLHSGARLFNWPDGGEWVEEMAQIGRELEQFIENFQA